MEITKINQKLKIIDLKSQQNAQKINEIKKNINLVKTMN